MTYLADVAGIPNDLVLPLALLVIGAVFALLGVGVRLEIRDMKALAPAEKVGRIGSVAIGVVLIGVAISVWPSIAPTPLVEPLPSSQAACCPSTPPSAITSTLSADPKVTLTPIRIDLLATVPLCTTVSGTGDVPGGLRLWFVVESDEPRFYFNSVSPDPTSHRWTATNVQFGEPDEGPGEPFVLYAVLLPEENSVRSDAGLSAIPADGRVEHRVSVVRNDNEKPCPP